MLQHPDAKRTNRTRMPVRTNCVQTCPKSLNASGKCSADHKLGKPAGPKEAKQGGQKLPWEMLQDVASAANMAFSDGETAECATTTVATLNHCEIITCPTGSSPECVLDWADTTKKHRGRHDGHDSASDHKQGLDSGQQGSAEQKSNGCTTGC